MTCTDGLLAPDPFTPDRVAELITRVRRAELATAQGRGMQRRGARGERFIGTHGMSRSRVAARYVDIAQCSVAEAAQVFEISLAAVCARRRRNQLGGEGER